MAVPATQPERRHSLILVVPSPQHRAAAALQVRAEPVHQRCLPDPRFSLDEDDLTGPGSCLGPQLLEQLELLLRADERISLHATNA